ncbi:MAG: hypothetical protein ABEL76_17045 [Bradymonadaceae bacterium]
MRESSARQSARLHPLARTLPLLLVASFTLAGCQSDGGPSSPGGGAKDAAPDTKTEPDSRGSNPSDTSEDSSNAPRDVSVDARHARDVSPPDVSPPDVGSNVGDIGGLGDVSGGAIYESTYKNMVLAGESPSVGDVALVAGTHSRHFPYKGDRPWDNGLLYIDGKGYHFTHRTRGKALALKIDTSKEQSRGKIEYHGQMKRASDGTSVRVDLSIPVDVRRYRRMQLGKPYGFLPARYAREFVGMRWQPFELDSDRGTVTVGNGPKRTIEHVAGEIEHGRLRNIGLRRFAFSYDYVNLAHGGPRGYSFVDFVGHALHADGKLGTAMDWYLTNFSSATITLDEGLVEKNKYGVDRPAQSDSSVVIFENVVHLKHADLRRQMIRTTDQFSRKLYGLREIFEPTN